MHIADDAYDLPLFRIAFILIRADVCEASANRVFARKVAGGKLLINDGHADPSALILFGKVPTFQQRDLDCLEVLRCDAAVVGKWLLSGFRPGASLNPEIASNIAPAERHRRNKRGGLDTG